MLPNVPIEGLSDLVAKGGLLALIIFLWWYDNRRIWTVLEQYKADMLEQRKMYEANVSLCKDFANVAQDLRSIVVLNTQVMTTLTEEIRQNQFCPMLRVETRKQISVGGNT